MGGLFIKPATIEAQKIGAFSVTEAAYGKPVPIIFGTSRLSGNIIDFVDFTSHKNKHHQGGKGGGGKGVTQIDYTYTVTASLGLCEGPIKGIDRVFLNKEIITTDKVADKNNILFLNGEYGQQAWPYMEGKHPDRALHYSGLAVIHGNWDLGTTGQLPAMSFEVQGLHVIENGDALPYDVIREILTNKDWGCGWSEDILGDNQSYVDYCREYGLTVSVGITSQRKVADIINDIMKATNSTQRWSQGKLHFIPLEHRPKGQYKPNLKALYSIDESDVVEGSAIVISRKQIEKKYNKRIIEFLNRDNFYEKEAVYAENLTDIQIHGLKAASVLSLPYITSKTQALYIAQQMLQRDLYVRNQYKFKLGVKHTLLEPGDIIYLSSKELMLERLPVMILSKVEDTNAEYDIVAEDVMFNVSGSASYETENASPYLVDRAVVPSDTHFMLFEPAVELSRNGELEVWVSAYGGDDWGSASVYYSFDRENYEFGGIITSPSVIGKVISSGNDFVTVEVQGSFDDRKDRKVYLGGDFVTVVRSELVGVNQYKLHGVSKSYEVGAPFSLIDNVFTIPYTIEDVGKVMYVKVVSTNPYGTAQQDIATVKEKALFVKGHTPPDVGPVLVEQMKNVKRIVWEYDEHSKPYIAGYRIKYNAGLNTWWDDAFELYPGLVTNTPFDTSQLDNGGIYTIMIKAVSRSGIESKNVSYALTNLGEQLVDNVLWEDDILTHSNIDLHNCIRTNDRYFATDNGDRFYTGDNQNFYPAEDKELFYRSVWQEMELISTFTPVKKGMLNIESDIKGNYRIFYRERYPYRFYPEDYQKMFDDSHMLMFKEGPWLPYGGKVSSVSQSLYDIKVVIKGGSYQGEIKGLKVIMDVPDINEILNDVDISSSGTRLPIKEKYTKITAINGTIQGSQAITIKVIDKSVKGPLIQLLDVDGQAVDGILDVRIQGY